MRNLLLTARGVDTQIDTALACCLCVGLPKGVVYTDQLWQQNMASYPPGVGFSYMPLTYITDRHAVYTMLYNGGRVGILSRPTRESGARHDVTEQLFADLQVVRPTVLKGVPKLWEAVAESTRIMHDSTLQILGGRVQVLICGAGSLHPTTAE